MVQLPVTSRFVAGRRLRIIAMLCRACLLAMLMLTAARGTVGEESWVLNGRVLDERGESVADIGIATWWNLTKGHMTPMGLDPTQSDEDGRFSIQMGRRNYFVLAIDKERKRGSLVTLDPRNPPESVDLKLMPLVRLHGRVRLDAVEQQPAAVAVGVRLPPNEELPLAGNRVAMCSSQKSHFEIWLPPGDYELESYGQASREYHLASFRSVTLADDGSDIDCGTLVLTPSPPTLQDRIDEDKAKGNWVDVDHTRLYGNPAPNWHAVDARGIPKDAQVSDFRGKWILVYFWGTSCAACLARELPALMDFYEAHAEHRSRFEIVAVCIEPELRSLAHMDRELEPIVSRVWGGKELPFPVVLDNTVNTAASFGVGALGNKLLIDPAGRLVEGDEETLAEKLEEAAANNLH